MVKACAVKRVDLFVKFKQEEGENRLLVWDFQCDYKGQIAVLIGPKLSAGPKRRTSVLFWFRKEAFWHPRFYIINTIYQRMNSVWITWFQWEVQLGVFCKQ